VSTLYKEFAHDSSPTNAAELFALMGVIWKARGARRG